LVVELLLEPHATSNASKTTMEVTATVRRITRDLILNVSLLGMGS
jgi:hypothetical protein